MNTARGAATNGARLCPPRTSRSGPETPQTPVGISGVPWVRPAAAGAPRTQPRSGKNPRAPRGFYRCPDAPPGPPLSPPPIHHFPFLCPKFPCQTRRCSPVAEFHSAVPPALYHSAPIRVNPCPSVVKLTSLFDNCQPSQVTRHRPDRLQNEQCRRRSRISCTSADNKPNSPSPPASYPRSKSTQLTEKYTHRER